MTMKAFLFAAALLASAATQALADRIVIVHGAFQTAAAWSEVAALLKAKGHNVDVVDLPGRDAAGDMRAIGLATYRHATLEAVNGKDEPVYLVGHSFGGLTIANTAEAAPAKIRKLIFVAAYLPKSGESMQALAGLDKTNKFTQENFVVAKDYTSAEVLMRDRGLIFANDAMPAVQAMVAEAMVKEPLKPIAEPLTLSAAYDGVAKAYIRTTMANAVSTPLQDMMIARAGVTQVIDLVTGHSPFITAPAATTDAIIAAMQ